MAAWLENVYDGQSYTIKRTHYNIGRDNSNDMVLDDPEISRIHSRISFSGRTYYIKDNSSYGTFVNGQSIKESPLKDGDEISLCGGRFRFRFRSDGHGGPKRGFLESLIDEIIDSLKTGWRDAELRNIWIACLLFIGGSLLPVYGPVSLESSAIFLAVAFSVTLFVLSLLKLYLIHIILGVNMIVPLLGAALFRVNTGMFVTVGPETGTFVLLAGAFFLVIGGYQGFLRRHPPANW